MSIKNILCLGDVIGVTGRYAVRRHLEEIKLEKEAIDLVFEFREFFDSLCTFRRCIPQRKEFLHHHRTCFFRFIAYCIHRQATNQN